jgi:anaphase-promoting complex subunit 1
MNKDAKEHIQVELSIQNSRRPRLHPRTVDASVTKTELATVPVAIAKKVVRVKGQTDAFKIEDQGIARVLCLANKGTESTLRLYAPWSPDTAYTISLDRLRIFSPFEVGSLPIASPRTVGKKRTLLDTKPLTHIWDAGPRGTVSLHDEDGQIHRIQVQLSARSDALAQFIHLLLFVLPSWLGDYVLSIWWNRLQEVGTGADEEWHALAISIFSLALSLDENPANRRKSEAVPRSSPSKSRKVSTQSQQAFEHMLRREADWDGDNVLQSPSWSWTAGRSNSATKAPGLVADFVLATRAFLQSKVGQEVSSPLRANTELVRLALSRIVVAMHLFREEAKLRANTQPRENQVAESFDLSIVIAQVGRWMNWSAWDWKSDHYYAIECAARSGFEDHPIRGCTGLAHPFASQPPPPFQVWIENAITPGLTAPYPTLDGVLNVPLSPHLQAACERFFPRIVAISKYLLVRHALDLAPEKQVAAMVESAVSSHMLETVPSAIETILKNAIIQCQASPPTTWSANLLNLINRDDLVFLASSSQPALLDAATTFVSLAPTCGSIYTDFNRSIARLVMLVRSAIVLRCRRSQPRLTQSTPIARGSLD